jgi:hypothetical protein
MKFFDYTILAGSSHSRREHESTGLVREAVAVFARMLEQGGQHFKSPVPPVPDFVLSVTRHRTVALATFFHRGTPVTTSALVPGRDPDDDREVIAGLQKMLTGMFHGTPMEPGFDMAAIRERPAIFSAVLATAALAGPEATGMVADMETCLAAAFFEEGGTA